MHSVTVSTKGQIAIPKELRDAFGLREGAKLVIEQRGDDELVLRRDYSDWRSLQGIAAGEDLLAAIKVEKDAELARE